MVKHKAKQTSKTGKPFIAARIPQALGNAIDARVESGEESKTDVIINALNAYLDYPVAISEDSLAADRLTELEKRIAEIERRLNEPVQTSLLDNSAVIETDKDKKLIEKPDNKNIIKCDKKGKSKKQPKEGSVINLNNTSASDLLTHRQVEEMSDLTRNTLRRRHDKEQTIEIDSKILIPCRDEGKPRWKLSDNNTD